MPFSTSCTICLINGVQIKLQGSYFQNEHIVQNCICVTETYQERFQSRKASLFQCLNEQLMIKSTLSKTLSP